jgi:hypothetical protein
MRIILPTPHQQSTTPNFLQVGMILSQGVLSHENAL